ncbi:MAG: DUF2505 domain-containing protein [Acidimicrobiales bacterium]|nr:DUF2505 domain-containing protein [Acidimicrobiales bacterium]
MGFKGSETYPAKPKKVFAMLSDPDVITARFEAAGDKDVEIIRCEPDGDGFIIQSKRTVTIDLPGFAKKALSPTNRMTQTERWSAPDDDGGRTATFTIEVPGTPVRTEGTYELRRSGKKTVHSVTGDLEIKIPIIGKKLGSFLSGTIKKAVADDLAFNKKQFD